MGPDKELRAAFRSDDAKRAERAHNEAVADLALLAKIGRLSSAPGTPERELAQQSYEALARRLNDRLVQHRDDAAHTCRYVLGVCVVCGAQKAL